MQTMHCICCNASEQILHICSMHADLCKEKYRVCKCSFRCMCLLQSWLKIPDFKLHRLSLIFFAWIHSSAVIIIILITRTMMMMMAMTVMMLLMASSQFTATSQRAVKAMYWWGVFESISCLETWVEYVLRVWDDLCIVLLFIWWHRIVFKMHCYVLPIVGRKLTNIWDDVSGS